MYSAMDYFNLSIVGALCALPGLMVALMGMATPYAVRDTWENITSKNITEQASSLTNQFVPKKEPKGLFNFFKKAVVNETSAQLELYAPALSASV